MSKEKKPKDSKKIKELKKQNKELIEDLQRLQAEFENYKKRTDNSNTKRTKLANKELIKKLLPILDNFQLAFENKDSKEFVKGMELVFSQLYSCLEENGLKKIQCKGKFDPTKHEVLLTETSKQEPETIIEELQPGYKLNNEIIRPAKVKVAKNKVNKNDKRKEKEN